MAPPPSKSIRCAAAATTTALLLSVPLRTTSAFAVPQRPRHGTGPQRFHATSAPIDADAAPDPAIERAAAAFVNFDREGSGGIDADGLSDLLSHLDLDATADERRALFHYLDADGDGSIDLGEFLGWYGDAAAVATARSAEFRRVLKSRRTVNTFDTTPVDEAVLRRAVECAMAAPNRSGSEPWRFVAVGPETVGRIQSLNEKVVAAEGDGAVEGQQSAPLLPDAWYQIPGWVVVTTKLSPDEPGAELADFRSTSCAMQNLMLSLWSEGVGSKWTEGPTQKTQQFADLVGVDTDRERVVGIIWYGFVTGGLSCADPKVRRKRGVDDVLSSLP